MNRKRKAEKWKVRKNPKYTTSNICILCVILGLFLRTINVDRIMSINNVFKSPAFPFFQANCIMGVLYIVPKYL